MEAQRNMTEEDLENFAYVKIFLARMLMKIIKITRGLEGLNPSQRIAALLEPEKRPEPVLVDSGPKNLLAWKVGRGSLPN